MELIVLGSSASYALPGEATSSYLIKDKDKSLLIDIGTGSLSNLFRWQDPGDISALIISHLHMDHFADIYPLRLYLNFEKSGHKLKVFAPKEAKDQLGSVLSPKGKKIFAKTLDFKPINEKSKLKIDSFNVTFKNMIHDIDSFAVKIEAGGKTLVYTSDTSYNENLVKFSRGCDLLLSEATLIVKTSEVAHMTVEQAGRLAQEANVKKLVLTHVWPTFKDDNTLAEAAKYYFGPIELAQANKIYSI